MNTLYFLIFPFLKPSGEQLPPPHPYGATHVYWAHSSKNLMSIYLFTHSFISCHGYLQLTPSLSVSLIFLYVFFLSFLFALYNFPCPPISIFTCDSLTISPNSTLGLREGTMYSPEFNHSASYLLIY